MLERKTVASISLRLLRGVEDIALLELSAVDDPQPEGNDPCGEDDCPGNRLFEEDEAVKRGEEGAEQSHKGEKSRCEALEHHTVKIVADDI